MPRIRESYVNVARCACFCAFNINSVARKQCSCDIAVSVRFSTSETIAAPYGRATSLQSM